jgi:hypothetical protein
MKIRFPLFGLVAFLMLFGLSSCVREYTCQCVIVYSGQPGLPDTVIREYPVKDTRKKAKSVCESNSGTYQSGDILAVETCEIF